MLFRSSFEDCLPIYDDLMLLPVFYELGVRFMGLSWSRRNFACDGAFLTQREHGIPGGLTAFGIELVHRCEQLGIILDVSRFFIQTIIFCPCVCQVFPHAQPVAHIIRCISADLITTEILVNDRSFLIVIISREQEIGRAHV